MGLLGPSLEDLFNACNRTFSLKTILMLAQQLINRLQVFHSKSYVYRDIKPQNFLMGLHENSHLVYMVDFGLSKKYRDTKNHQHIAYKENRAIIGTVRYCSINSHLGLQYGRRDDLQSIGYMLQYFYKGNLPWQGIRATTNADKYAKILSQKQRIPIQVQFSDMPVQFSTFMRYCRTLKFADRPDYMFLRKLFTDLMQKLGYKKDYLYDWCQLKHGVKLQSETIHLSIRNKYYNMDNPSVTQISNKKFNQNQIHLNFQVNSGNQDNQDNKENKENKENQIDEVIEGRIQNNYSEVQIQPEELDQDQGNIDPNILEDSDLRLISARNKWFDNQI